MLHRRWLSLVPEWACWRRNIKSKETTDTLSFCTFSNLQNILQYTYTHINKASVISTHVLCHSSLTCAENAHDSWKFVLHHIVGFRWRSWSNGLLLKGKGRITHIQRCKLKFFAGNCECNIWQGLEWVAVHQWFSIRTRQTLTDLRAAKMEAKGNSKSFRVRLSSRWTTWTPLWSLMMHI
jgi:hypothetical protein